MQKSWAGGGVRAVWKIQFEIPIFKVTIYCIFYVCVCVWGRGGVKVNNHLIYVQVFAEAP